MGGAGRGSGGFEECWSWRGDGRLCCVRRGVAVRGAVAWARRGGRECGRGSWWVGLVEFVDEESGAEFGFEPSGLWRHDFAGVGDGDELLDGDGVHGEGDAADVVGVVGDGLVDASFEFVGSADAADEVDAFVGADVADAEDGFEDAFVEEFVVEARDGIGFVDGGIGECNGVPLSGEVHAEASGVAWFGVHVFFDASDGGEFVDELIGREAVEVFDEAVVWEDVEFGGGEESGEEPVVFFVAGVFGVFVASLRAGACGGGGAVVSVGDVGGVEFFVGGDEGCVFLDAPDGVSYAVGCGEVVERLAGGVCFDEAFEVVVVFVEEEDGAGVGVEGEDVAGAVVFFGLPCFLVLFDDVVGVVVDVAAGDDADLGEFAGALGGLEGHGLAVDVDAGRVVAEEGAVGDEAFEVVLGGLVDGVGVGIGVGREVDVGTDDVEEGEGVALGESGGFVAVDDVVGDGSDAFGGFGCGSEGLERVDSEHVGSLSRVLED